MKNHLLLLDNLVIHINRKPIKHIYVRIQPPDGQVSVSIPLKASLDFIQQQLEHKKAWIQSQQKRMQLQKKSLHEWENIVPFLGKPLQLVKKKNLPSQIYLDEDNLYYPENASKEDKKKLLDIWYRKKLQGLLPDLIAKWEPIIGVSVAKLGIRAMKTRWGSCNTKRARIWLNLSLIKKPIGCIEYVLVHEMVHLLEASHNKRFYLLMDKFMPDWRIYQDLLRSEA